MQGMIFDVGMYDGADTRYYLESGFKVVSVEANPNLIARAEENFRDYIRAGQLQLVHAAVGGSGGTVELTVCGDDLGSSSIFADRLSKRYPLGSYSVASRSIGELFDQFGVPQLLKVDIEGADAMVVSALSHDRHPRFLSFEAGNDAAELIGHVRDIGYKRFKAINQCNFLPLGSEERLVGRVLRRAIRLAGIDEPGLVKRRGRWFKVMHSSGPAPWDSPGPWLTADALLRQWHGLRATGSWYDVHAAVDD